MAAGNSKLLVHWDFSKIISRGFSYFSHLASVDECNCLPVAAACHMSFTVIFRRSSSFIRSRDVNQTSCCTRVEQRAPAESSVQLNTHSGHLTFEWLIEQKIEQQELQLTTRSRIFPHCQATKIIFASRTRRETLERRPKQFKNEGNRQTIYMKRRVSR